jgi:hypothetical protein
MILLDADVLLLDIRYPRDIRFATNERLLQTLHARNLERGITLYALLEVIGVLSFNLSTDQLRQMYTLLPGRYGLQVVPHWEAQQYLPTFPLSAVLAQIEKKMAMGDAVQGMYIEHCVPQASCLLSWNVRHFRQELTIPVLTPQEWLIQHNS